MQKVLKHNDPGLINFLFLFFILKVIVFLTDAA